MLLVGTDAGIYFFSPQAQAWESRGAVLEDAAVTAIVQDPTRSARLFASAREGGVFRSNDGGQNWDPALEANAWCVSVAQNGTAYAGVQPAGVYRSRNGGTDWQDLETIRALPSYGTWSFPGASRTAHVRSLVFSSMDPRFVYGGVEVGGAIGSSDGGETWSELRQGVDLDIHTLACAPNDANRLYAATGGGLYRSRNGGAAWERAYQGLHSTYTVPLAVHPTDARMVFTAAAKGPPPSWSGPDGAAVVIYRSSDGADTWVPVMEGLPPTLPGEVYVLAVDPASPDTLYAGTGDGQVLVSRSLGDSWRLLAEGLPPVHALASL